MGTLPGERLGSMVLIGILFSFVWAGVCFGAVWVPLLAPEMIGFFAIGKNVFATWPPALLIGFAAAMWGAASGLVVGPLQADALKEQSISGSNWKALTLAGWIVGAVVGIEAAHITGGFERIQGHGLPLAIVVIGVCISLAQALVFRGQVAIALRWAIGGVCASALAAGAWVVAAGWVERAVIATSWADYDVADMVLYGVAVVGVGAIWGLLEGARLGWGTGLVGQAIARESDPGGAP